MVVGLPFRIGVFGFRVWALRFMVQRWVSRIRSLPRVSGSGCRVEALQPLNLKLP